MKEVTLKFYSVDEKLPTKDGWYLTVAKDKNKEVSLCEIIMIPYSVLQERLKYFTKDTTLWDTANVKYWAEIENIKEIFKGKE